MASPTESITLVNPRRPRWQRAWYRLGATLRGMRFRRRLAGFGNRSAIDPPASIFGGHAIRIGDNVSIWAHARLEAFAPKGAPVALSIGDNTIIQPYVHIGAVKSVTIGREVLMASRVYITDHDHDFSDPKDPVVSNGKVVFQPTVIEDRVWLGEAVMVLKGVTIGEGAIVGAASVVTKDVPPYSIAVGSPARVVRRYDEATQEWVKA